MSVGSFTCSPAIIGVNTTGNTITLTGTATVWASGVTTFSIVDAFGASVGSVNILSTTSATVVVNAGSIPTAAYLQDSNGLVGALVISINESDALFFVDDFHRANGAIGNGWTDQGNTATISSNQCLLNSGSGATWNTVNVYRPTSDGTTLNQLMITALPANALGSSGQYSFYHYMRMTPGASSDGYCCGYGSGNNIYIFVVSGGSLTGPIASATLSTSYTPSHNYSMVTYCLGSSPTSVTTSIWDLTTGVEVATCTHTDSTGGLQAANLQYGMFGNQASGSTILATTATINYIVPVNNIAPTPKFITENSTNQSIGLVGTGTAWTGGTTWTLSGGYNQSIVSHMVSSGTVATLVVDAGTTPSILTISDGSQNGPLGVTSASGNTLLFIDNFERANAASLGNNWSDPNGKASISSNACSMNCGNSGNVWNGSGVVYRPTTDGQFQNQELDLLLNPNAFGSGGTISVYGYLRLTYASTTSSGYVCGYGTGNTIYIFPVVSGTLGSSIASAVMSPTYNAAHSYAMYMTANGVSPTTITCTLVDLSTGVTVATCSGTDSTAQMQNSTSTMGLFNYGATASPIGGFASYEFSSGPATAYTFTGPTTGPVGSPTSNFTVALSPTGGTSSSVTITPSDSGHGGTFTPSTVTLSTGTQSATFTYTPAGAGVYTLLCTNSGTLTNPSGIVFTAVASSVIPVNNAAFHFSPGNWTGNTGRGGTSWRSSWNNGAYFSFTWNAASSGATAVINLTQSGSSTNTLVYFLNGIWSGVVSANVNSITLTGIIAGASNTVMVVLEGSVQLTRWNYGINTVRVDSVTLDGVSTAGVATTYPGWILIVGDSITEGILSIGNIIGSNTNDYSWLVGSGLLQLGYDYCVSANGGNGYMVTGDGGGLSGDIPPYYRTVSGTYYAPSRWQYVDQGISLLDSNGQISAYGNINTPPALIFINMGANDYFQSQSTSDLRYSVNHCIASLRAAAPNAWVVIGPPFGMPSLVEYSNIAYWNAIQGGYNDYIAANPSDTKAIFMYLGIDQTLENDTLGGTNYMYSDNVHPIDKGHALIASRMIPAFLNLLIGNSTNPGVSNVINGVNYEINGVNYTGTSVNTDPGVANVISGINYEILSVPKTGTNVNIDPGVANVTNGVGYEILSVSKTGTNINTDPGVGNVKNGINYEINSVAKTGTNINTDPGIGNVRLATNYEINSVPLTGTLVVGGTSVDPGISNVKLGVGYEINSVNLTGTLNNTDPGTSNVTQGVAYFFNSNSQVGLNLSTNPGASNVLQGIQYYINSTEYTGSATGGSGSITNLFNRAVLSSNPPFSPITNNPQLTITQGNTAILQFIAENGTGSPVAITGASFSTQINGPNGVVVTFGNAQHSIQNSLLGEFSLTLASADTANLGLGNNKEVVTTITIGASVVSYRGFGIFNVLPGSPLQ